jgi:hypothetical protein
MSKILVAAIVAGGLVSFAATANGQSLETPPVLDERSPEDYYQPQAPRYEPDTSAIIQQKAMRRAEQRIARLEARSWHQRTNSRATVSAGWGYSYGENLLPMPLGHFKWPRAPLTNVAVSTGLDSAAAHADAGRLGTRSLQNVR